MKQVDKKFYDFSLQFWTVLIGLMQAGEFAES